MSRFVLLWLFSLVLVAALASAVTAQVSSRLATPPVFSGPDLGFRIDRTDAKGRPVGTLVIRVNGDWVEASFALKANPAATY